MDHFWHGKLGSDSSFPCRKWTRSHQKYTSLGHPIEWDGWTIVANSQRCKHANCRPEVLHATAFPPRCRTNSPKLLCRSEAPAPWRKCGQTGWWGHRLPSGENSRTSLTCKGSPHRRQMQTSCKCLQLPLWRSCGRKCWCAGKHRRTGTLADQTSAQRHAVVALDLSWPAALISSGDAPADSEMATKTASI